MVDRFQGAAWKAAGERRLDLETILNNRRGAMRAKLFCSGRSQAVRLPAEFRFEGTEVEVHRDPAPCWSKGMPCCRSLV